MAALQILVVWLDMAWHSDEINKTKRQVYCTPSVLLVFIIFYFFCFSTSSMIFFFLVFLYNHHNFFAVKSQYLEAEVHLKLLISKSKFSGPRKFTLIYQ